MSKSLKLQPLYACFVMQETYEEQWFFIEATPSFFPNVKDEDEQDELEGIRDSRVWTFLTDKGFALEQGYIQTEEPELSDETSINYFELS